MLSLACSKETTWSSVDITSAFLNADIHEDDTVLITPPPILVKMEIVKPNTVWHVKKSIYGLREAPRLWQQERDQQLRDLEFVYNDISAHLVQSYTHPSLWFIAEGPRDSTMGVNFRFGHFVVMKSLPSASVQTTIDGKFASTLPCKRDVNFYPSPVCRDCPCCRFAPWMVVVCLEGVALSPPSCRVGNAHVFQHLFSLRFSYPFL